MNTTRVQRFYFAKQDEATAFAHTLAPACRCNRGYVERRGGRWEARILGVSGWGHPRLKGAYLGFLAGIGYEAGRRAGAAQALTEKGN